MLLKIAAYVRRVYWRLFKPVTLGVRALLIDHENKILLVKHTYVSGWFLPGGGVRKNERINAALGREMREEIGAEIDSHSLSLLGVYSSFSEYKADHIIVFVARIWSQVPKLDTEVEVCGRFPIEALPPDVSPGTKRRVNEYLKRVSLSYEW